MTKQANDFKKIGTFNGIEITTETLIEPPIGMEEFADDIANITNHKRRQKMSDYERRKRRSKQSRESYLRGVERDAKKVMRAIESGEVKL